MRFRYYLKWSLKQIRNYPIQSIINILGLSLGLTVFALITLYVWHQNQMDKFHPNLENIYRLENNFQGITPATYLDLYEPIVPEIKKGCRWGRSGGLLHYQPQNEESIRQGSYITTFLTDSSFFSIFNYPLIRGKLSQVFASEKTIILTESTAQKIFGDTDPMNKMVTYDGDHQLTVKAIMKDPSVFSSIQFDAIIPFNFFNIMYNDPNYTENWYKWMYETHFLLADNSDPKVVKAKIDSILNERYMKEYNLSRDDVNANQKLRPYQDIYFSETGDHHAHGKKSHITIFSIIAIFVLLIACINYINISTALASTRFKTLGIKKINGATRRHLIISVLSEGIFIAFLSVVLSVLFIEFSLPWFRDLTGLELSIPYSPLLIVFIFILVPFLLGLIASIYPSCYITSFNLTQVLKGEYTKGKKGTIFRKVLTILQFSISVFLIIGTLVVRKQLNYINHFDPGYQTDQIAHSDLNPSIQKHFGAFESRLLDNPDILDITRSSSHINNSNNVTTINDGEEKSITVPYISVDENFFPFFDIDVIWGRSFNESDLLKTDRPYIINEKMAKWFGGIDTLHTKNIYENEIIGVVENIQVGTLHQNLQPITFAISTDYSRIIYFKINAEKYQETLKYIENVWNSIAPEFPFEYKFLNDDFELLYKFELQFSRVFTIFAVLSIFIACLGLFALASFISLQRTREIGIRKAHGASTLSITLLLSKELTLWVLLANIIAIPVSWYYMDKWLNSFAHKTTFSVWIFIAAIFISLVIALSTILYHTIQTALKNPADSLKYE